MARTRAEPITSVTIRYDLFDLPTAQHKAGLAGLILQIRSMEERAKKGGPPLPEAVPTIDAVTTTAATVTFTEKTVQGLFDDLYDAQVVEVAVKSKWPGKPLKREEVVEETDKQGKKKQCKRFIQPRGHFLRQHLPDGEGVWLKLWRDMLWAVPRGNPQARIPFDERAAKESCKEGKAAWKGLVQAWSSTRRRSDFHTAAVAGSLLLGAQAENAEAIPFEGRAEHNLLLHFWPLTALIFVPQQLKIKHKEHKIEAENKYVGYALAIPEVSDVKNFVMDYPLMLNQLDKKARGYRPAEAVIDLLPASVRLDIPRAPGMQPAASQKANRARPGSPSGSVEILHSGKVRQKHQVDSRRPDAPRPNPCWSNTRPSSAAPANCRRTETLFFAAA